MKKKTPKTYNAKLERYSEIELQWCKINDAIQNLIRTGAPEEHWVSLLTAARMTTAALNRIANKNPELVEVIAKKQSLWPYMVSPFENDRSGHELTRKIKLGAVIVRTTSTTPLTQAVSMIAVDILQIAKRKKQTADEYKTRSNIPPPLVKVYAPLYSLPSLKRTTFEKWRVSVFKPEFDAMWPKIEDFHAWRELSDSAKKNCSKNPEYTKEVNLKNHVRKRVMTAIKALLPME
jgi:hypothetical protein